SNRTWESNAFRSLSPKTRDISPRRCIDDPRLWHFYESVIWGSRFLPPVEEHIELSRRISDEIKCTTCYMCACRCGIKVHLNNGRIRSIEANRDHPVNKGVLCAKGSPGIMPQNPPARLTAPLLRVGP